MATLYTNNASTTLASGITNSATSLTVTSGNGTKFPSPTGIDYFMCTLQGASGTPIEIIKVTARSTDTFTIVRAQEGTTASAFNANDIVELRVTAAEMTQINQLGQGNASMLKNRVINGQMVIDQRNAGASVTPTNGAYTLDRWQAALSQSSKFSVQQNAGSVTPPVGFTKYLGVTSLSAYSVGISEVFNVQQVIEGFNIADLGWGTANAKTVTLSFQVYSSLTGTFGGALRNGAGNRSYPFSYSIPVANTWTSISVPIVGDTSGTWTTDNTAGLYIRFGLGVGSTFSGTAGSWSANDYYSATGAVSVVGTSGATFYITGVQLEVGSSATGFEYRVYSTELANCQRYCQWLPFDVQFTASAASSVLGISVPYKVTMRIVPSFTSVSADPNTAQAVLNNSTNAFVVSYSGVEAGVAQLLSANSGNSYVLGYRSLATAEL